MSDGSRGGKSGARAILAAALAETDSRRRWLADPGAFAFEVIGPEALEMAAGRPVGDFTAGQRDFLRAFCDTTVQKVILKTGRGGSKTFLKAVGVATVSFCLPAFTTTILAGSLEQGRILYHYFEAFAASPRFARCLEDEPTKTYTALRGGGWVRVLTASEKQVKGPHPKMLVIDEACAADPDIIDLAMGQRLGSTLGLLRVASTPDKLFHPFRDWWTKADEQGWKAFAWGTRTFREDRSWEPALPWIPREVIEDSLRTQPSNWVRIHVDGEFGSATGTVFRFEDVEAARIGGFDTDPLWNEEAVASYRTGIDWGFQHPTVITTTARLTVPNYKALGLKHPDLFFVVHVEGWSQKSEDFIYERIGDVVKRWPGDVYLDSSHPFQNETVGRLVRQFKKAAHAVPFVKEKMAMVGHATVVFENGRIRIPRRFVETLDQCGAYSWEENRERPLKVNDDYVDSLLLSLWGHRLGAGGPPGAAYIDLSPPGGRP